MEDLLKMEPQALATAKRLVLASVTEDDRAVLDDAAESLVGLLRRPEAAERRGWLESGAGTEEKPGRVSPCNSAAG